MRNQGPGFLGGWVPGLWLQVGLAIGAKTEVAGAWPVGADSAAVAWEARRDGNPLKMVLIVANLFMKKSIIDNINGKTVVKIVKECNFGVALP
jgi:hypothetical protein